MDTTPQLAEKPVQKKTKSFRDMTKTQSFRDHVSGYLYVSPFILLFLIFGLFPILYTLYISLFRWKAIGAREFVGFRNYVTLFTDDPLFWQSIGNTFSIWVMSTVPQLFLALILAVILNSELLRAKSIFRLGIFLPNITSIAAVAIIFSSIFAKDYGLVNYVLSWVGIDKIDWTSGYWSSQFVIALMVIWRWTGYNAIIYLAALQSVPKELYESATIDGANRVQQFFYITIPMIRPMIMFTVVVSTIGGMQIFVEPFITLGNYEGGQAHQGLTMVLYMMRAAVQEFNYGYASAVAWVIFMIIMIFVSLNWMLAKRIKSAD